MLCNFSEKFANNIKFGLCVKYMLILKLPTKIKFTYNFFKIRTLLSKKSIRVSKNIAPKAKCEVDLAHTHRSTTPWRLRKSWGRDPHTLNLYTRWKWAFSFSFRPIYPLGKAPGTNFIGDWVDLSVDAVKKRKFYSLCPESNLYSSVIQHLACHCMPASCQPSRYVFCRFSVRNSTETSAILCALS